MLTPQSVGIDPRHDRIGVDQRVPCPKCERGERDRAASFRWNDGGCWVAQCFRCGWKAGVAGQNRAQSTIAAPAIPDRHQELAKRWARYYADLPSYRGTLGERYLQHRGCAVPPVDGALRFDRRAFHWPTGQRGPALVALASDVRTRAARTLHFTFLAIDGRGKADLQPVRLLLSRHEKSGAVIRLWPDDTVTSGLGVAEGIESALSLAHAGLPVWAAIDAGNLAALPILDGIDELAIAVDRDPAGERAADALAHRWITAGRRVRLVKPRAGDLNDVATGTYGA